MKPTIAKNPWMGSVAQLKMWCSIMKHKSGRIIVNSAKKFSEAANQFCPSITTLFQRSDAILSEPIDIEEAPIIPGTLKILNLKRSNQTATGEVKIDFFFL